MEDIVRERLISVLKENNASINSLCNGNQALQRKLNRQIKEGSAITSDTISSILEAFPNVSAEWLIRGKGNMVHEINSPVINYITGVPYYNVDFIGGFDVVLNDQTVNPEYYIDFKLYNNAEVWCNVTGHSMEPEISHGDIIALKELHDWKTYIPSGEIYAIVTTEHRTVKRISPAKEKGFITLIPSNPDPKYCAQDIPLSIVLKIYKVLGCMKRL